MTNESIAAIQAVEEAESMFATGNSMAAIRQRILGKPFDATTLAYIEGYMACMARRTHVGCTTSRHTPLSVVSTRTANRAYAYARRQAECVRLSIAPKAKI